MELDGTPIEIPSRPAQSLLAYLILNASRSIRREKLAGLLWPDSDETTARNNLRQTLWRLRKAVGDGYVVSDKFSIAFDSNLDYNLDAATLEDEAVETESADALIRSVSVYEGRLLPGFYDDWVTLEAERLEAVFEDRIQMLLERLTQEARWREVREWAERWLAQGQVPEPAYRALMMAHAGLGDLASVAAVFQRCIETLEEELGVEPSPETQELFHNLTSGEIVPKAQAKGTKSGPTVKLPLQPTPFIGRKDELSRLATLLADPTIRQVTILGPGGMGKTRLAIEAARAQSETFADGVYFVSLTALDNLALIPPQIADAVNFSFYNRDQREQWTNDPQHEQLLAYLCNKQLLLVMDNVEHLLTSTLPPLEGEWWKKGIEEHVAHIIEAAPGTKILVTSRERLSLRGETLFPLDGLDFPKQPKLDNGKNIEAYSAIQLFAKSARRVQPEFELSPDNLVDVIDICRLVDGIPLGIELAAAWVELLSPAEIATEIRNSLDFLETDLHDIPDRQRSLRSVFETTWKRLITTEQAVFQQLSVFQGGFTREAAQAVANASLRTLMALVNKSLLRPDLKGRYQIHELLRQFGAERLAKLPAEETAARDRHCAYYAAFLKDKEADIIGPNQGKALAEIETEIDNARAAWSWAATRGKLAEIEQALESLSDFYRIRGGVDEGFDTFIPAALAFGWEGFRDPESLPDGYEMFNETMQLLGSDRSSTENDDGKLEIMGKILARQARFYCETPGRALGAAQIRQDSLKILSRFGARREMAYILRYLGHVGHTPWQTKELYQHALAIFKESGDNRGIIGTLYRLGRIATQLGDYEEAEQLYQESLSLSKQRGRVELEAIGLIELSYVHWVLGNYQTAKQRSEEALLIYIGLGYLSEIARLHRVLARVTASLQDYQTAKQHLQDSLKIFNEIGLRGMRAETLSELAHVAVLERNFVEARQLAQKSLALCEEQEHRTGMVEPFTVLGEVALGLGEFREAETYFQKALQTAIDVWVPSYALHALVGMAQLRAAMGDKEQALELATFIRHNPASWQWSKDSITPLAAELEAELPSEIVTAIHNRATEKTLEQIAEALMVEIA